MLAEVGLCFTKVEEEKVGHVPHAHVEVHPLEAVVELKNRQVAARVLVHEIKGCLQVIPQFVQRPVCRGQAEERLELHPAHRPRLVEVRRAREVLDGAVRVLRAHDHEGLRELLRLDDALGIGVPGSEESPDLALLDGRELVELLQAQQEELDGLLPRPGLAVLRRPRLLGLHGAGLEADQLREPAVVPQEALLGLSGHLADDGLVLLLVDGGADGQPAHDHRHDAEHEEGPLQPRQEVEDRFGQPCDGVAEVREQEGCHGDGLHEGQHPEPGLEAMGGEPARPLRQRVGEAELGRVHRQVLHARPVLPAGQLLAAQHLEALAREEPHDAAAVLGHRGREPEGVPLQGHAHREADEEEHPDQGAVHELGKDVGVPLAEVERRGEQQERHAPRPPVHVDEGHHDLPQALAEVLRKAEERRVRHGPHLLLADRAGEKELVTDRAPHDDLVQ
mmetsp:Transcript_93221/g.290126  ORF Transcript_93221/g.290126 Transcript_93221/m.290126 type:complete len:449 (-) Transcript_93221:933-2279(-)